MCRQAVSIFRLCRAGAVRATCRRGGPAAGGGLSGGPNGPALPSLSESPQEDELAVWVLQAVLGEQGSQGGPGLGIGPDPDPVQMLR